MGGEHASGHQPVACLAILAAALFMNGCSDSTEPHASLLVSIESCASEVCDGCFDPGLRDEHVCTLNIRTFERPEARRASVQLRELEIELFGFEGEEVAHRRQLINVSTPSNVSVTVVDAAAASMLLLGSTVAGRVTVHGTTPSGSSISSVPWDWPITVCEDCCTDVCRE